MGSRVESSVERYSMFWWDLMVSLLTIATTGGLEAFVVGSVAFESSCIRCTGERISILWSQNSNERRYFDPEQSLVTHFFPNQDPESDDTLT